MSEARPLILGEAPSRSGDKHWRFPLSGAVGERLCTWAGLEPEVGGSRYGHFYWPLRKAFELRNLIERWPGGQGLGSAFPMPEARMAWEGLMPSLRGRVVVLLGARLAATAQLRLHDWGRWQFPLWCGAVVAIPHPSGLNRLYNATEMHDLASATLRQARTLADRLQPIET